MARPTLHDPKSKINGEDVRAIVRLLGQVIAHRGAPTAKKQMLMDGLCRMIGGDFWVWTLCASMRVGEQPIFIGRQNGGLNPVQLARHIEAVEHPQAGEILAPFSRELNEKGIHLTRSIEQIDPEDRLNRLDIGNDFRNADIGRFLLSFRPLDCDARSAIGIFRRVGKPAFNERELRIAHILLTEVPWLHEQGLPGDRKAPPVMCRRERTVLSLLSEGQNRRQIAEGLGISEHTANGYVKSVYRHFNVSSHAELLHRLTVGDGAPSPTAPTAIRTNTAPART